MTTRDKQQDDTDTTPEMALTGDVLPSNTLPTAQSYGYPARVSDVIPTPDAWAEYDQIALDDLVDHDIIIEDLMMFPSLDYEGREWGIMLFADPATGERSTTAAGGTVLLRKLKQLKEWQRPDGSVGMLPIVGRVLRKPSRVKGQHDYYDLI